MSENCKLILALLYQAYSPERITFSYVSSTNTERAHLLCCPSTLCTSDYIRTYPLDYDTFLLAHKVNTKFLYDNRPIYIIQD